MDNRIYRSRETKMLGGVCGGIADMFNIDPTLVRLVAVALTFLSGFTFLLVYVMCAIIIPLEPERGYILKRHQRPENSGFSQTEEPSPAAPAAQEPEADPEPQPTPEAENVQDSESTESNDMDPANI